MQYRPGNLGAVIVTAAWHDRSHGVAGLARVVASSFHRRHHDGGSCHCWVLRALLLAVALSLVDAVRRSATPARRRTRVGRTIGPIRRRTAPPKAKIVPECWFYRLDDRLFFANAHYVKGRIHEAIAGAPAPVRWLVFDAEALTT